MFKKISMYVGVAAFGLTMAATKAFAAADQGFASSTDALELTFTDNSGNIWLWIGASIGIGLLLGMGIRALLFGKRQIIGGIPGGRKGRR